MHCMSYVYYWKIYICRKIFVLIDSYLSIISWYIFEMLFDYFISYLYKRVLKLTLGKKISAYFPLFFQLLLWSVRMDMFLRLDTLGFVDLLFDSIPFGRVCTTSGRELFAFFAKHILLLFACPIMSCCVCFLSDWFWDFVILYTSFLIPRYFLWLSIFS